MSTLDSARYGHRDWAALVAAQDPNDVWTLPGGAGELIGAAPDEQLAAAVEVLGELGERSFTGTGLASRLLAGLCAQLLAAVRGEHEWRASRNGAGYHTQRVPGEAPGWPRPEGPRPDHQAGEAPV